MHCRHILSVKYLPDQLLLSTITDKTAAVLLNPTTGAPQGWVKPGSSAFNARLAHFYCYHLVAVFCYAVSSQDGPRLTNTKCRWHLHLIPLPPLETFFFMNTCFARKMPYLISSNLALMIIQNVQQLRSFARI